MPRGPEAKIARNCDSFLEARGWLINATHGNRFQKGFPDRFILHREYGRRWIDYKAPNKYSLTAAQRRTWPAWDALGEGIWIMTEATDQEYKLLFGPPNWRDYWHDRYGAVPDIDALLEAVEE